jgi:hypothetical protein
MTKKLLKIASKPSKDWAFSPSIFALKMATSRKNDFEKIDFPNTNRNNKLKMLMV